MISDLPEGVTVQVYPVSVKGVVARRGRILLLHNDRGEWELPGGRLEMGESPQQCVVREIAEETGWAVTAGGPAGVTAVSWRGQCPGGRPTGRPPWRRPG